MAAENVQHLHFEGITEKELFDQVLEVRTFKDIMKLVTNLYINPSYDDVRKTAGGS